MSLSTPDPDKLTEIRRKIRKQISALHIDDEIRDMLSLAPSEKALSSADVFARLESLGVLKQLVRRVESDMALSPTTPTTTNPSSSSSQSPATPDAALPNLPSTPLPRPAVLRHAATHATDARYLYFRVKTIKGLAEYMLRDAHKPGEHLVLYGMFGGQRFSSRPVAAGLDAAMDLTVLLKLPGGRNATSLDLAASGDRFIHLSLIRVEHGTPHEEEEDGGVMMPPYDAHLGPSKPKTTVGTMETFRECIGTALVDWRKALVGGIGRQMTTTVELRTLLGAGGIPLQGVASSGSASAGPMALCGALEVKLEILPAPSEALAAASWRDVQAREARRDLAAATAFTARVRSWWMDLLDEAAGASNPIKTTTTSPSLLAPSAAEALRQRHVLLLAYGEDGVLRPSCSYMAVIPPCRALPSPFAAARFVSLLSAREDSPTALIFGGGGGGGGNGGTGLPCIASPHHSIASQRVSALERALLLAAMLRGFALDAVVCCGTDARGVHYWVWTRHDESSDAAQFWEPRTARRYPLRHLPRPGACPYVTLDCVLAMDCVFVNVQGGNTLLHTSLNLENAAHWRRLDVLPEEVASPLGGPGRAYPPFVLRDEPLLPPLLVSSIKSPLVAPLSVASVEVRLEQALRRLLASFRASELGVPGAMTFDASHLEPLLMPALEAYEQEAVSGASSSGNAEFRAAVARSVPAGYTFQAVPSCHASCDASHVLKSMVNQASILTMLQVCDKKKARSVEEERVQFALRTRVVPYAEGVVAVWVLLAIRYPDALVKM